MIFTIRIANSRSSALIFFPDRRDTFGARVRRMASQVVVRFHVLSPGWSSGSCVYRRVSPFDAWGNRNGTRATHQNDAGEFMKIFFLAVLSSVQIHPFPFSAR